jgi:lipoprotein NlpD
VGASGAKNWPKTGKEAYSEQAASAASAPAVAAKPGTQVAKIETRPDARPADDEDKVDWGWPVRGKMLGGFSESTNKGIDISAKTGDPVSATASGKVVYSGSGLRGYGKLIVIKHNATYFSAYAHNNEILVKEGQLVVKGQKIAEVGSTDAEQPMLHFEIRKQGKPVDPLKYLPAATAG